MGMNSMAAIAGAMKGAQLAGGTTGSVADRAKKTRKKLVAGAATAGAGDPTGTGLLSGVAGTRLVGPAMRAAGRGFMGY